MNEKSELEVRSVAIQSFAERSKGYRVKYSDASGLRFTWDTGDVESAEVLSSVMDWVDAGKLPALCKTGKFVLRSDDGSYVSQNGFTPILVKPRALSYTFTREEAEAKRDAYSNALGVNLTVTPYGECGL